MSSLADETRWMDATAQAALVAEGEVTPSELLEAAIERIEADDPPINAVNIRWFDHAREVAAGELPDGPFRGVPFLLKDLYSDYTGQPLTNGNRALKALMPRSDFDTTLVARYKAAGFVTAGRTNSCEFGALPTTEPVAWGPTRTPWDLERTSGGSSGGAAAAVAAGLVPVAHASDGGGSIRIPASCCGVVGLKVSQGRISAGPVRNETVPGVDNCVSRTVRDTARVLDATQGRGIGDSVIAPPPLRPYVEEIGADPGRLRIGLLAHDPRGLPLHADCEAAVRSAAAMLEGLGHDVDESYPEVLANLTEMVGSFRPLWAANRARGLANLAAILGREVTADDVEPVAWAVASSASQYTALDLAVGQTTVARFRRETEQWWADGWDVLLTPTLGEPPVLIGEHDATPGNPVAGLERAARFVPFTSQFNMTGQPAISLPLHWSDDGLPIGVQLVASYGREDLLLRVASQLEAAHPWADRHPPRG